MYPGLKPLNEVDLPTLQSVYEECCDVLRLDNYVCSTKLDYMNERRLLEEKMKKKKSKKDIGIPDANTSPMSNWCSLLNYRVKTNILDSLASGQKKDDLDFKQRARQVVDVTDRTSTRYITQHNEISTNIIKEMLSFRKKTKDCYSKKQPTPISFWESIFKTSFPKMNESGQSSMMLHEQINSYIDQGIVKFEEDLINGIIPESFYEGTQFYLNYLLRVTHIQISDDDIYRATRTQSNQIDALMEYTLGNVISVMKIVFFRMYSPTTGVLIDDKEHLKTNMLSDVISLTNILYSRICFQFPKLQDQLFLQLIQTTITNALFVHISPLLQDIVRQMVTEKNTLFVSAINTFRISNPEVLMIHDVFLHGDNERMKEFVMSIDATLEIASPLYKIKGYQALMNSMFHYVYLEIKKNEIEMSTTEIMDSISTFILLINYQYFYPDLQFLMTFRECTPLLPTYDTAISYLYQAYIKVSAIVGVEV